MLHFCHGHIFRSHHHRNATGESVGRKLIYPLRILVRGKQCRTRASNHPLLNWSQSISRMDCSRSPQALESRRARGNWTDRWSRFCPRPNARDAAIQVARSIHMGSTWVTSARVQVGAILARTSSRATASFSAAIIMDCPGDWPFVRSKYSARHVGTSKILQNSGYEVNDRLARKFRGARW